MNHSYFKIFTLFLFFLMANGGHAQTPVNTSIDIEQLTYSASENSSIILWERVIEHLAAYPEDASVKLQLAYAYYGLTTACLSVREKSKGKAAIKTGLAIAEEVLDHADFGSEANALVGGLHGLSIAFSPMKGMFLGPKSDRFIKSALEKDDQCAFAWLQKGSSQINTPKMFGGSVIKSIDSFKKAVDIYENCDTPYNWQHIEALVWLGQAYHKTGQKNKAIDTYEQVLEAMPNYGWVKRKLLPDVLQAD